MKLAWVTDIHLDFLAEAELARFCDEIASTGVDGVLVGGDIALANSFDQTLLRMGRQIQKPIWFVLGNHDFYGSSVAVVRKRALVLSEAGQVVWLGGVDAVELSPRTGLVGHDGWGDARIGDHAGSTVMLNDFFRIEDLQRADKAELARRLGRLGDEAAAHLRRVLPPTLERFEHVLVLTHVPPFREACWHEGRVSGEDWLPYFTCKAVGDVLLEQACRHVDRSLTVLCGHTHSGGEYQALPNLRVVTGAAEYGRPRIQQPLLDA